ncbi:unnamed protein product [Echinostoma caproni]|uniref:DNA topoisomerase (ATP-hydrolyzing) n=1 Tax=Echinostoma caproni TaxID=27848 RepID=A0A183B152_9TREM|nr:unnamed protein product [Echinostoma caproni]
MCDRCPSAHYRFTLMLYFHVANSYPGLGTSSSKEAKEYFSDMARHRIRFRYSGQEDDVSIQLAFDKSKVTDRKTWLTDWTAERKRRRELGLPEPYLYGKDTRAVSYHDFVHKELVLFSNLDNERSIPSVVDGLKPGQRKVLFTCLKRNLVKEIKVAQLSGSVSEMSAYHHGEQSLMGTIVGLAQNFVGSNNLNLLLPIGQFGTRLCGGKDAASARYIFTALSPLTRLIFHPADDPILTYLRDDNQRIEPEWYCPIIPMILVNGADGIGTGYATRIPNYSVLEVIANLYRLLNGDSPLPMIPNFRGFRGTIQVSISLLFFNAPKNLEGSIFHPTKVANRLRRSSATVLRQPCHVVFLTMGYADPEVRIQDSQRNRYDRVWWTSSSYPRAGC